MSRTPSKPSSSARVTPARSAAFAPGGESVPNNCRARASAARSIIEVERGASHDATINAFAGSADRASPRLRPPRGKGGVALARACIRATRLLPLLVETHVLGFFEVLPNAVLKLDRVDRRVAIR